jgi:hypothetical protein
MNKEAPYVGVTESIAFEVIIDIWLKHRLQVHQPHEIYLLLPHDAIQGKPVSASLTSTVRDVH